MSAPCQDDIVKENAGQLLGKLTARFGSRMMQRGVRQRRVWLADAQLDELFTPYCRVIPEALQHSVGFGAALKMVR